MFHKYTHLILTIVTAGTVSRCAFCASKHIQAPLSTSTLRVSRDIFAFTNSNIIVIEFFLPGIIHLCISIRPTTFKKRKKKIEMSEGLLSAKKFILENMCEQWYFFRLLNLHGKIHYITYNICRLSQPKGIRNGNTRLAQEISHLIRLINNRKQAEIEEVSKAETKSIIQMQF